MGHAPAEFMTDHCCFRLNKTINLKTGRVLHFNAQEPYLQGFPLHFLFCFQGRKVKGPLDLKQPD